MFDKDIFFESVRVSLFNGKLLQSQVDGMEAVLDAWMAEPPSDDSRWLAYCFATDYHETSKEMQPIEEYGRGSGMSYGVPDKETGQTYYGRGYVQLTWRDNYQKATDKIGLEGPDDLVWHASRALDPYIASEIMFRGMVEGWFRSGNTLEKFFSDTKDDPFGAREIINGDKNTVPSWSNGVSIGNLIKDYHNKFLAALDASYVSEVIPPPEPIPEPPAVQVVNVYVRVEGPPGIEIRFVVDDGSR